MNENLKKVIETSTLIVHEEIFVCVKVRTAPPIDGHFFISRDSDEITVITGKENSKGLDLLEKSNTDRSLLEIQFSPDSPDATGFLAAVSSALADKGISISVISTYSKDYILVPKEYTEKAVQALRTLGLT